MNDYRQPAREKEKIDHCNKYACIDCPIIDRCSMGSNLKYYYENPFELVNMVTDVSKLRRLKNEAKRCNWKSNSRKGWF